MAVGVVLAAEPVAPAEPVAAEPVVLLAAGVASLLLAFSLLQGLPR